MCKKLMFTAIAAIGFLASSIASAQTNFQTFYDISKDRGHFTTTLEGFYADKWGNTFFFVDHDYNSKRDDHVYAPSGTYMEIARCLNFWSDTKLAPFSLHVEYNGGVYNSYTINNAFLFGVDWFLHSSDFKNTLNLKVLFKSIDYTGYTTELGEKGKSKLPLQFTAVWGIQDLFKVKGLRFSGFADFWWEEHYVYKFLDNPAVGYRDWTDYKVSHIVFLSEPQLWYNVGQHFGCENLNVGGELELSYDFGTGMGFFARPALGFKWVF